MTLLLIFLLVGFDSVLRKVCIEQLLPQQMNDVVEQITKENFERKITRTEETLKNLNMQKHFLF